MHRSFAGARLASFILFTILITLAACAKSSASAPPEASPGPSPVAQASGSPAIPGLPPGVRVEFVTPTPDLAPTDALKLVFQPGSQARYRAREMMLGRTYMTDAIGSTDEVEGTVYVSNAGPTSGSIVGASIITIGLQGLKSDEEKRDEFIKEVTLETDRFPQATFVPTKAEGLPKQVADDQGTVSFRLNGDLTVHGVTKPTSWVVNGNITGDTFIGTAVTTVALGDFGMTPPQVPIVLGVDDNVRLELSFTALRQRS